MRKLSIALLVMLLVTSAAYAHQDRILTLIADGSIPEIPAYFGRTQLMVSGLGTDNPLIQLKIGMHQTTLPVCVARLIRITSEKNIRLTGSWYHNESTLPYYINVQFYYPSQSSYNTSYRILYNLHNAKLLKLTRFESNKLGEGVFSDVILPESCKSELTGMWSNNSFSQFWVSFVSVISVVFGLFFWYLRKRIVRRSIHPLSQSEKRKIE